MKYGRSLPLLACMLLLSACSGENGEQGRAAETASYIEESQTAETAETEPVQEETAAKKEQALTMDELILLCENDGLSRLVAEQGLEGFQKYENLEEVQMESSLTWMYTCKLPWQDREYELQIYFWMPGISPQKGHEEYEIDAIHLVETETGDRQLLYTADSEYEADADVLSFLEKQYGLEQYMTFALPEGVALGAFSADMGGFSGSLLVGDYEEALHGDGAEESWYAPGGIAVLSREQYLSFENGKLSGIVWMYNHSWISQGPERLDGCEMQALLYEIRFDLFTAAELGKYWEENGIELSEEEATSQYWYVFMGNEDSENGYAFFLNERYFTKEDVIRLASSAHVVKQE